MKLEEQVCSLELAKKLKELGVKQDGYFSWELIYKKWEIRPDCCYEDLDNVMVSAFTVAELGEILISHNDIEVYEDNGLIFATASNGTIVNKIGIKAVN